MSHFLKMRKYVSLFVILISTAAFALSNRGGFQTTKIGALQQVYSGATNRSFALGSPGYGVELSADSGNTFLRYFFKSRFTYSEGKQNFLDSAMVFNSSYKFVQFAPEIGLSLYPVSRRNKGANGYVWGVGCVSYNNLELKNLLPASSLRSKDQAFGYGYGGGGGFEFILGGSGSGSYYLLYGEIGFREERTNLVNYNQFEISGMTYSIGLGF